MRAAFRTTSGKLMEPMIRVMVLGILLAVFLPSAVRTWKQPGAHACAKALEKAASEGGGSCPVSGLPYEARQVEGGVQKTCCPSDGHAPAAAEDDLCFAVGDASLQERFPEPTSAQKAVAFGIPSVIGLLFVPAFAFMVWYNATYKGFGSGR